MLFMITKLYVPYHKKDGMKFHEIFIRVLIKKNYILYRYILKRNSQNSLFFSYA